MSLLGDPQHVMLRTTLFATHYRIFLMAMKQRLISKVSFLFLLCSSLFRPAESLPAQWHCATDVASLEESLQPKTKEWVIWDVDHVLLWAADPLLRVGAIEHSLRPHTLSKEDAVEHASHILLQRSVITPSRLPQLIQDLCDQSIFTFCCTAWHPGPYGKIPSIAEWRHRELSQFGYQWNLPLLHTFPSHELHPWHLEGVFYSGAYGPKGKVLRTLYEASLEKPLCLWMIDDRVDVLQEIDRALQDLPMEVHLVHFLWKDLQLFHFKESSRSPKWTSFLKTECWKEDLTHLSDHVLLQPGQQASL